MGRISRNITQAAIRQNRYVQDAWQQEQERQLREHENLMGALREIFGTPAATRPRPKAAHPYTPLDANSITPNEGHFE